jgi:hypothetical protein
MASRGCDEYPPETDLLGNGLKRNAENAELAEYEFFTRIHSAILAASAFVFESRPEIGGSQRRVDDDLVEHQRLEH